MLKLRLLALEKAQPIRNLSIRTRLCEALACSYDYAVDVSTHFAILGEFPSESDQRAHATDESLMTTQ